MHGHVTSIAMVLLFFGTSLFAQDDNKQSKGKTKAPALWMRYCEASVNAYEVREKNTKDRVFPLRRKPVLVHRAPLDLNTFGLVYLRTQKDGRPVAVVTCIAVKGEENLWSEIHEFHSFHDRSLVATRRGAIRWAPEGPGIDWKEVPDAPAPSRSVKLMQSQAKLIAKRFSAKTSYGEGKHWNLELKAPLHSYECDIDGRKVAGSLMAFARATDPEVFLLLEVRKTRSGELRWHYGLANFAAGGTHVELDDTEVFAEDPPIFRFNYRHQGYWPDRDFDMKSKLETLLSAEADSK